MGHLDKLKGTMHTPYTSNSTILGFLDNMKLVIFEGENFHKFLDNMKLVIFEGENFHKFCGL